MHFSSETFYHTEGPSHKAWYWNHGLRWQTSLVCHSCGKCHALCSIRLLRCVLCWCSTFFEHVILRSCAANCGTSSIFMSQMAVDFSNAIRTDVYLEFSSLTKRILFFILLSCFKQCVLGLSGLPGLNAVILNALLLQCNHCLVFGDVLCS